ncbi:hypothetical protein JYT11_00485 [Planctomycetaceae bacterium AH-315-I19]|nr:hypothetical protein [Planctomycetaceae bacterium AH-315-I19]
MQNYSHTIGHTAILAVVLGAAGTPALADIIGFNNLAGWKPNQGDAQTPISLPDPNTVQITSQSGGQLRSIFYETRQSSAQFTASFTYRADQGSSNSQGASFILQNDPAGPDALGGFGIGLGYAGIVNSIATTWDLRTNTIGFSTGGVVAGGVPVVGIDLGSNNDIDFTLTYDGNFLTQRLVDTVTGVEFVQNNILVGDISSFLGGDLAYVGFSATSLFSDQFFSNFRYTAIPAPGSLGLFTVGLCAVARRRRH